MLFKDNKKGVNFSCASPASAAICTSIERRRVVEPSTGGSVKDKHAVQPIRDPKITKAQPPLPLLPYPSASSAISSTHSKALTYNVRKSFRKSFEQPRGSSSHKNTNVNSDILASPGSSARFLLNTDEAYSDDTMPVPANNAVVLPSIVLKTDNELLQQGRVSSSSTASPTTILESSSPPRKPKPDQVVVLKVSLHCKGCERKVKKHISKMEGVTSFRIDFARKKVTVIGDITPLSVLNSVSKVKNAQFWPSPSQQCCIENYQNQ